MARLKIFVLLLVFTVGSLETARAEKKKDSEKPLYEAGVGIGTFFTPDYPGAAQGKWRTLGLPYMIYRGRVLRADEDGGLRGRFLNGKHIELDLSASAAFPADSEDNQLREGMQDLDWIGEIGPRLSVELLQESRNHQFDINLPLRAVISTDFTRIDFRGLLLQPNVLYRRHNIFNKNHTAYLGFGLVFATDELMDYFYEVEPEYAHSDRPHFAAEAGYLGAKIRFGMSYEVNPNFWVFWGVQQQFFDGATNSDSPLLVERYNTSAAIGFIWKFFESEEKAGHWL